MSCEIHHRTSSVIYAVAKPRPHRMQFRTQSNELVVLSKAEFLNIADGCPVIIDLPILLAIVNRLAEQSESFMMRHYQTLNENLEPLSAFRDGLPTQNSTHQPPFHV